MVDKDILRQLPSIPDYYKRFINSSVDLNVTPYQPCPLHNETNGRSFSYSSKLGIWQCFGACHCGGDVVKLHMKHQKLSSYDEALKELCSVYGVKMKPKTSLPTIETPEVDEQDVYRRRVLALAMSCAKTVEDYLQLDYIVSKVPYDVKELEVFCSQHKRRISNEQYL